VVYPLQFMTFFLVLYYTVLSCGCSCSSGRTFAGTTLFRVPLVDPFCRWQFQQCWTYCVFVQSIKYLVNYNWVSVYLYLVSSGCINTLQGHTLLDDI
jgi:hypothetical protein